MLRYLSAFCFQNSVTAEYPVFAFSFGGSMVYYYNRFLTLSNGSPKLAWHVVSRILTNKGHKIFYLTLCIAADCQLENYNSSDKS